MRTKGKGGTHEALLNVGSLLVFSSAMDLLILHFERSMLKNKPCQKHMLCIYISDYSLTTIGNCKNQIN